MIWSRLRSCEWIFIAFFAYTTALIPFFPDRPRLTYQPVLVLAAVAALLVALAVAEQTRFVNAISMFRDWIPMLLTLTAFRELELFLPVRYNTRYEQAWNHLDYIVLNQLHLKDAVESLGPVIPCLLELSYLLVYGVGTFCLVVLWLRHRRTSVDRFYVILLTGTLLSYALFPYFPSRPPRVAFPDVNLPSAHNVFRTVNLFLLNKATIHTGVFPSAHVSSVFAAAWAMFLVLPGRKRYGWGLLIYAVCVSIATIYGRYHYTADAFAGFGISLIAGSLCLVLRARTRALHREDPQTVHQLH